MKKVTFSADGVKIRTGKPDNSAEVVFTVGEYCLEEIKELVTVVAKELKIIVEVKDD